MEIPLNLQVNALLQQAIESAQKAGDLPEFEIPPVKIDRPKFKEQGDYASGVSLTMARPAHKAPLQIAEILVKHLPANDFIGKVEVVKPGFINMFLAPEWMRAEVPNVIEAGKKHGHVNIGKNERVQVEFVSANPTGPLTIGSAQRRLRRHAGARL